MKDETCIWTLDTWDGFHSSQCGQNFIFNYPREEDEDFKYCPYCSKEIHWNEPTKELDDA